MQNVISHVKLLSPTLTMVNFFNVYHVLHATEYLDNNLLPSDEESPSPVFRL